MLAHGHLDARQYPLWMVWEESERVVRHINRLEATRAVLLQMAVSTVISKEAHGPFKKVIAELTDGREQQGRKSRHSRKE